jgi:phosphatidylglycerol lysyltransferase
VWRFLEQAREQGGRASFYQVRPQTLPFYLDAGLRVYKLGEYAYVPLTDFSLKGKARQDLRSALNRGEREGMTLEVLPAGMLPSCARSPTRGWPSTQRRRKPFRSARSRRPICSARQSPSCARTDAPWRSRRCCAPISRTRRAST